MKEQESSCSEKYKRTNIGVSITEWNVVSDNCWHNLSASSFLFINNSCRENLLIPFLASLVLSTYDSIRFWSRVGGCGNGKKLTEEVQLGIKKVWIEQAKIRNIKIHYLRSGKVKLKV